MKKLVAVFVAALLCFMLLGCEEKPKVHNYIPVDVNNYITEDIEFYTEKSSYAPDTQEIICSFEYIGSDEYFGFGDSTNCILIRKQNEEWYMLRTKESFVSLYPNVIMEKGPSRSYTISLTQRYELPLEEGIYRLVWSGYMSKSFRIEGDKG